MIEYILNKLIMIPIVLIALTFHEFSHGWVSTKLGDPTPRMTGRLSLNPMAHLDPVGALLMILTGFGWAKPVQIDARYYKNPKRGMALTAAAGPISNFLLALVGLILYMLVLFVKIKTNRLASGGVMLDWTSRFIMVNLCFMIFNLIPIPPLDGSRILGLVLSNSAYFKLQRFERYSFLIIIVLSLTGVFDAVIGGGVGMVLSRFNKIIGLFIELVI